jgi:hypothetical protein
LIKQEETHIMSKKLFTGLAPLVAIAAFAVMPVAAQAVPHYLKNAKPLTAGAPGTPTIGWSTALTLSSPAGIVSCQNAVGGEVSNPAGGGAGVGATLQFATWNCKQSSGECKSVPGVVETRVVGTSLVGEKAVLLGAAGTGWPSELEEPEAGLIRNNTKTGSAAGAGKPVTGVKFECYVGGAFAGEIVFYGSSTPKNVNGTSAAHPSKAEFGPGSGELEALGGAVKGTTTGKVKFLGYEEQELITAE